MPASNYDVIIIGGGPGGSAAATYIAKAGKRALVLEKEQFPRFHIGESLLPYNRMLFEEMGALPALEAAGFPLKFGAQFHVGNASKSLKLAFRRGRFTDSSGKGVGRLVQIFLRGERLAVAGGGRGNGCRLRGPGAGSGGESGGRQGRMCGPFFADVNDGIRPCGD